MSQLFQLWLPIMVAAVAVFIASSLIHMVFKWHNSDYKKLANEDEVRAAVRAGSPAPGQYVMPHCMDMKDMKEDAMKQKFREGPIGLLTIRANGEPNMNASLSQWFVLNIVIAAIAACVALQAFGIKGNTHNVAHLVGVLSFLAYGCGGVQSAIWMGLPWSSAAKGLLDALIYGTVSALAFMWLMP